MAKSKAKTRPAPPPKQEAGIIWTAGHSTHSIEDFLTLLAAARIEALVDVRRYPGSRRHPQFNQQSLAKSLLREGIEYIHLPSLGGRRTERLPDSPSTAWRVKSFNAYADHVQSAEFAAGLRELLKVASHKRAVIVCSEALPHRCHRRIIADVLVARGWEVRHLLTPKREEIHTLTPFARVEGEQVSYPEAGLFEKS